MPQPLRRPVLSELRGDAGQAVMHRLTAITAATFQRLMLTFDCGKMSALLITGILPKQGDQL